MSLPSKALSIALSSFMLSGIVACNGDNLSSTQQSVVDSITTSPVNVMAAARQSAQHVTNSESQLSLLANGSFEQGILHWSECQSSGTSNTITNDAYDGQNSLLVGAGSCVYQSVKAEPNSDLILSCYVKIDGAIKWTGMGLGFSDVDWISVGESTSTVVTSTDYQRYDVRFTAPDKTEYVSMWFYSQTPAFLDQCTLTLAQDEQEPPPLLNNNLLVNGDFSSVSTNMPDNWVNYCGGDAYAGADGNSLALKNGACVSQSFSASTIATISGTTIELSCDVENPTHSSSAYSEAILHFDGHDSVFEITGNDTTVSGSVTVPEGVNSGFISFYSENKQESLKVSNCQLQIPLQPPEPPQGDLLVNGEFIEGGDTADGWTDLCNGGYLRSNGFNGGISIKDGACVQQYLSNDVLAALQGQYFAYSCQYTKTDRSNASISTNLGIELGSIALPPTYYGGVPNWQIETVTLYGKAKDQLEPGESFVAITDNGVDTGTYALGCSLKIVSGQTYSIGDIGPAGGIVFSLTADGMHGLEAAPADVEGLKAWCADELNIAGLTSTSVATIPDLRAGSYNTDRINFRGCGDSAARNAREYVWPNGQTDGYLPNKEELVLLYQQRDTVGAFSADRGVYASSSQALFSNEFGTEDQWFWGLAFFTDNATPVPRLKRSTSFVRSIRSF